MVTTIWKIFRKFPAIRDNNIKLCKGVLCSSVLYNMRDLIVMHDFTCKYINSIFLTSSQVP
jgi:hypothetical protein